MKHLEPLAVFSAAAGDRQFHAEIPDKSAVLVMVVAAIARHHIEAVSPGQGLRPFRDQAPPRRMGTRADRLPRQGRLVRRVRR